jgi:flagellar hook-associated protein FlgK
MDFDQITKSRMAQTVKDQNDQIIKLLTDIQAGVSANAERLNALASAVESLTKKNKKTED